MEANLTLTKNAPAKPVPTKKNSGAYLTNCVATIRFNHASTRANAALIDCSRYRLFPSTFSALLAISDCRPYEITMRRQYSSKLMREAFISSTSSHEECGVLTMRPFRCAAGRPSLSEHKNESRRSVYEIRIRIGEQRHTDLLVHVPAHRGLFERRRRQPLRERVDDGR